MHILELNLQNNIAYEKHVPREQDTPQHGVVNIQSVTSQGPAEGKAEREGDEKCSVQANPAYWKHSRADQIAAQESGAYEMVDADADCSTFYVKKVAHEYEDISNL